MPTILCVEDDPILRTNLSEELQDSGYQTLEACNGLEAIKLIHDHNPDLILCDISMPSMDGLDFLEQVRKEESGIGDIPFVFLSAISGPEHVNAAEQLGVLDYLTKPIDFDQLIAVVERTLAPQTPKKTNIAK
jgi:CheY-like chemotaxis protein